MKCIKVTLFDQSTSWKRASLHSWRVHRARVFSLGGNSHCSFAGFPGCALSHFNSEMGSIGFSVNTLFLYDSPGGKAYEV